MVDENVVYPDHKVINLIRCIAILIDNLTVIAYETYLIRHLLLFNLINNYSYTFSQYQTYQDCG